MHLPVLACIRIGYGVLTSKRPFLSIAYEKLMVFVFFQFLLALEGVDKVERAKCMLVLHIILLTPRDTSRLETVNMETREGTASTIRGQDTDRLVGDALLGVPIEQACYSKDRRCSYGFLKER